MNDKTAQEIQGEITEALAKGGNAYDQDVRDLVRDYQAAERLGV